MTKPIDLQQLAGAQHHAMPYDFAEFQRRSTAAERRRGATMWSVATLLGVLGTVALIALMTQKPASQALLVDTAPAKAKPVRKVVHSQPALVDMGQFALTSELEDHIALLDEQISVARVYAAPPEQLRQLEYTRKQLNESLQRVSYAQNLLNF